MVGILLALATAFAEPPTLEDEVVQALSTRDQAPVDCTAVLELGDPDEVRDLLVHVADTGPAPPWVPMRAATCVAALADVDPVARTRAEAWLDDPERPGLALAVVHELPRLAPEAGIPLADRAVVRAGSDARFAAYAAGILERSGREDLAERGRRMRAGP